MKKDKERNDLKLAMERFKCFLYGTLIALLSSLIVFTVKNVILEEHNKEINDIKSFGAIAQYLPKFANEIFKGELYTIQILKGIILNLKKFGIKSSKKHKKQLLISYKSLN
ncbi:hypothetical protein QJR30_18005 (plasmid) [Paraclostridium sordellii]|nr:hypothetical protein [Paeniclostridium sordellii]CEP41305.1 Uncharacterised protein [[Clostridium] sordellii] [Paeniclostridium sordellii]